MTGFNRTFDDKVLELAEELQNKIAPGRASICIDADNHWYVTDSQGVSHNFWVSSNKYAQAALQLLGVSWLSA